MTTTELIHLLSSHLETPVAIRIDGYVSEEDPRGGRNQPSLDHYTRLSAHRILSAADVLVAANSQTGEISVEIVARIHVDPDTGEGRGPSVAIGMMSAEDVVGVPIEKPYRPSR